MSVPELPSNFSYQEEMFKYYLEDLYPTKSQDGVQIMLNCLLGKHRQQYPITTPEHAQNFHISNMSVPELPPNISSLEEMSQTSLERFSAKIERLETKILSTCAPLQISKLPTKPKEVLGYREPIKWDHVFSSNDVEEE